MSTQLMQHALGIKVRVAGVQEIQKAKLHATHEFVRRIQQGRGVQLETNRMANSCREAYTENCKGVARTQEGQSSSSGKGNGESTTAKAIPKTTGCCDDTTAME